MDILTRIRNTSVADLATVRADFADDAPYVWSPKQPKNMVRIVEGADDLKVNRPAPKNPGAVTASDWTGDDQPGMLHDAENPCNNPVCCTPAPAVRDRRSEGQVRYMDNLISWITEKDQAAGDAARVWTDNVTEAGKWSYDKADKFSISGWIDRLKAKNAELNAAAKVAPVETPVMTPTLPVKADKNGKPMPLYYAVDIEGVTKFYRIKPGRKDGFYFVDAQASDEFHAVRSAGTKATVISAIVAAGPDACMARYGQLIGSCGRCHRTLTDADSRARGIGPDCMEKM